ncbi:MAG: hypothetical protein JWN45_888 [Acidobacteriaceae bacterium]|nr:hypothetical protein [Acidobacteriaceae bacterium]
MITDFVDILFGCWHSNYSFPITAKVGARGKAAQVTGTYVVCLDCGKEFPYDWTQMKVVGTQRPNRNNDNEADAPDFAPQPALIRKQAA